MQILLKNKPLKSIDRLNFFLQEIGKKYNISKLIISEIDLALGELLTNIINYGYIHKEDASIQIDFKIEKNKISFTLIDSGIAFNPLEHQFKDPTKNIKEAPIGGLGIMVAKKSMDSLSYERKDNRNILKLVKNF